MANTSNFQKFVEEKLMPISSKLASNRYLGAMRDAFAVAMPYIILGAIGLLLTTLPCRNPDLPTYWEAYDKLMAQYRPYLLMPFYASMQIMSIYVAFGIGYHLAKSYSLNAISGGFISLFSFIMVSAPMQWIPMERNADATMDWLKTDLTSLGLGYGNWSPVMRISHVDAKGLFTAILIGFLAVEVYRLFVTKKWTIKMPDTVPPAVVRSFEILLPVFFMALILLPINIILLTGATPSILPDKIQALFAPLVQGASSLPGLLLLVFMIHALWFFGLHGANIFNGFVATITLANLATNQAIMNKTADAASLTPQVFAGGFMDAFVYAGGSGATLGLCMLLMFSRAKQLKEVGKLSIGPALFNINEPIIFGAPIVMNPIMGIPFIVVPLLNATIAYTVMKTGAIGYITSLVPWTTPAPLVAFFSTNFNIAALVLSVGLILLSALIYFPFLKAYEKQLLTTEGETV